MKEAFWIIDQLIQQGVQHFCIAPGSRSTPLALAAIEHKKAQKHVHFDERGLGFYALGIGKGSSSPAVVISTSGTAVGNLLPSIMEAHHTCTPVIFLTADRPPELRDCTANQTTDQIKIFQPFVRWQMDLGSDLSENYFRSVAAQTYFHACQNPSGPVQLNCPLRDPLYSPGSALPEGTPIEMKFPKLVGQAPQCTAKKGILFVGRLAAKEEIYPILELGKRLQWPIFADILSNARSHRSEEMIRHFDPILKRGTNLQPECILHFGDRFASKKLLEWTKTIPSLDYFHISPFPFLQDPNRQVTGRYQSDAASFCSQFQADSDREWLAGWKELDREVEERISSHFAETNIFTEAHAMRAIGRTLPPGFAVFLGNGMPIRDGDRFLFPASDTEFYGNRGLSGIDGNIATVAGICEGTGRPLLAFIGDQACLHDLNSLPLLLKSKKPIYLIVSNNFGGGIFSHLPISESPHFEPYWAASHEWHFEEAAKMFGIPYVQSNSEELLERTFRSGKSILVELTTNRAQNYQFHKELQKACSLAMN